MSINGRFLRQHGITLIEQIVFIIVVSVGVIGVLSTLGPSLRFSADPQLRKQQLTIAESLLSEVLHQPFTYCDPDDPQASTAVLSGTNPTCTNDQNNGGAALGPVPAGLSGEYRLNTTPDTQFDNVADYAGYVQNGVTDLLSSTGLVNFSTQVVITRIGSDYTYQGVSLTDGAALRIDVTVTGGGAEPLTLTGYRFRYAPRY